MPAVEVALLFQSRVEEKLLSENVNPPAEVEGRHVHDRLTLSEKEERWCMLDVELLPKMEKKSEDSLRSKKSCSTKGSE